ncbi:MAG: hypothetical protein WCK48_02545 [bacterium]
MKLYIIPGYKEDLRNKGYKSIIAKTKHTYDVRFLKLNYDQLLCDFPHIEPNSIVIGFSIGALIAYYISTKIKLDKAVICSMSPLLESDFNTFDKKDQREIIKLLTLKTWNKLKQMKYTKSLSQSKNIFLFGENEIATLKNRSKKLGKYVEIKNTGHELTETYVKEILKYI